MSTSSETQNINFRVPKDWVQILRKEAALQSLHTGTTIQYTDLIRDLLKPAIENLNFKHSSLTSAA